MKQFLKKEQIQLLNGGYLSNTVGSPVCNSEFVAAQKNAEWCCTFAELAKGKDFKGKKADSLSNLQAEVVKALQAKKRTFVDKPTMTEGSLTTQLAAEALAFMDFAENTTKADKINEFMQQFNVLAEFQEFGLFFEDDIVKLNRIYSIEEVTASVQEVIDLLK